MPTPKAEACTTSTRQRQILEKIAGRVTNTHQLVTRAQLVLYASSSMNNTDISKQLNINRATVRKWRTRWIEATEELNLAFDKGVSEKKLKQLIIEVLSDQPRPGTPAKFSVEQIVQIVAVACEQPSQSERPVNQWTPTELAQEAVKRGIVEEISPRSVGRFLKRSVFTTSPESLRVKCPPP
ncbi:helix-turn-helix domain-containing protein [Phormidium pseudopriestleyi FRX01]|uniref:Helix-turn-helix domain-containing protein n=1 Tax=Phormidium pseudopriestleyi FRX01 TaxID=1759528 RepID=A0ABS3FX67_9CYAN|nr:helix-turn-helix domain-containing protein [Phormidium pseudopriestleyi]MBO0351579.1 helix-turn-helix domain-containing protein [Phormidium pseudopriestleyi FRX01]